MSSVDPSPEEISPTADENPRLGALKSAWSASTAEDREKFSKWLLTTTAQEVSMAMKALEDSVSSQLWQQA